MPTVSVDFDGVLHPFTAGWVGWTPADEPPITGAREFLAGLRGDGFTIVVVSSRAETSLGISEIWQWLSRHDLDWYVDEVTDKKVSAVAYVDDRAVPFSGSWAESRDMIGRLAEMDPDRGPGTYVNPTGVLRYE